MKSAPLVDRENCCKMPAKVRKYKVGKRNYLGISKFCKIHRGCGKKKLAFSEGVKLGQRGILGVS